VLALPIYCVPLSMPLCETTTPTMIKKPKDRPQSGAVPMVGKLIQLDDPLRYQQE